MPSAKTKDGSGAGALSGFSNAADILAERPASRHVDAQRKSMVVMVMMMMLRFQLAWDYSH